MIIALAGFIGSGKDTVGRYFVEEHGYQDMAFADALKDTCAAIFCWDREMLDGKNPQSREWRNQVDPWWAKRLGIPDFTPRRAMQLIGTDTMRRYFHDDLWIMNVERRIEERRTSNAPIVITDGRFPNELKLVQQMGGKVLRVKRGAEPEWFETALQANTDEDPEIRNRAILSMGQRDVHRSEWAWIGYPMDRVIENDGTLDALFSKAEAFIKGNE